MVATLKIYVDFGGTDSTPGTSQDTTSLGPPNIRLKTADDATIDTVNPIPIPSSSVNRSFTKACYVYCSAAPDTQVNNLKVYTDGAGFGTGITTYIGDQFPTKNHSSSSGYRVALGTVGTTGTIITTVYASITTKTDLFTFTSGSPMTGPTISETSNIIVNIGDTSNYFVLQAEVGTTASPGNKTDEQITVQYDEI
jgi:hypothetical protein